MLRKLKNNIGTEIRHYVFGAEDGLISTLGIVLGVSAGGAGRFATLLAGIASATAGATSMAAGDYLSTKSEREVFRREIKDIEEFVKRDPEKALQELEHHYLYKEGMKKTEVKKLIEEIKDNKMLIIHKLKDERRTMPSSFDRPGKAAIEIFSSFIISSIIPIFPYAIFSTLTAQIISSVLTLTVLFCVGAGKTIFTKKKWYKSGIEMVIVGISAAVVGFLIGELIGKIY